MRCIWACAGLLAMCATAAHADFVNVATGSLAFHGTTFGVAWGDYDRDGDPDLFITTGGAGNKLFRNDSGTLHEATPAVLADIPPALGAAWGDYDNDGDLDLYVGRAEDNRLFRNQGGTFVDVASGAAAEDGSTETVSWIDFDRDGDLDLYLVNYDDVNRLVRNDNLTFVDITPPELAEDGVGRGAAWGDYDRDGDSDLYLGQGQGSKLFRNDWPAGFAHVVSTDLDAVAGTGVDWGDYDNDGHLDLYVGREAVVNRLLRNGGDGTFEILEESPVNEGSQTQGVAWADIENDGDLDLWVGNMSGENRLFRNEGFGFFLDITPAVMANAGSARGAAWADYDLDGDLDLYVAVANGANKLFRNDLLSNNKWLFLDLVGTLSNRSAVGARVTAWTAGVPQVREVQAGYGLYSMGSLTVEFGFGNLVTQVDSLNIRWPSGRMETWTHYPVNVRTTVHETPLLGVADGGLPAGFALHAARPNPFLGATRIRYELAAPSPVSLRVFDVTGRLVRVLADLPVAAEGSHEAVWDGRTDGGQPASAGLYLYRLDVAGGSEHRKITLLRQ